MRRRQNLGSLPFRNTWLFHCTLYTDFTAGCMVAVARHVSIAQIIC